MMYSTQVALNERGWTTKRWEKWRLTTNEPGPIDSFRNHNLVCGWLESHPEDAEKYLRREPGFGCLDILLKAEKAL